MARPRRALSNRAILLVLGGAVVLAVIVSTRLEGRGQGELDAPPAETGPDADPASVTTDADDAVLAATTGAVVTVPADSGCGALPASGTEARCDIITADGTDVAWVIEREQEDGAITVRILRRRSATEWTEVLRAGPEDTAGYRAVDALTADLNGDEVPELAVAYRADVDEGPLALDVVDVAAGVLVGHVDVPGGGRILAGFGALTIWEPVGGESEPAWNRIIATVADGRIINSEAATTEPPPTDAR